MSTDTAVPQQGGLVAHQGLSRERIDLIKRTIAKGASDDELALFIEQCNRTGLDPFSRQIYSIRRGEYDQETKQFVYRNVTEVGIDGMRVLAERTKKYAGQVGPLWCGPDGKWVDVWLSPDHPMAAKVGILRTDFPEPLWAVARWESYVGKKKDGTVVSMWVKLPDLMLAKCAEALALRKAFPYDTSGLYIAEEMSVNVYTGEVLEVPIEPPKKIENKQEDTIKKLVAAFMDKGIQLKTLENYIGRPVEEWQSPEIEIMRTCYKLLKSGEKTTEDLFGMKADADDEQL